MTTRSRLFLLLPACLVLCAALSAAPSETPKLWPVPADQPPVAYSGGNDPTPRVLHYTEAGTEVNRALVLDYARLCRAQEGTLHTAPGEGVLVTEASDGAITYLMDPTALITYQRMRARETWARDRGPGIFPPTQ